MRKAALISLVITLVLFSALAAGTLALASTATPPIIAPQHQVDKEWTSTPLAVGKNLVCWAGGDHMPIAEGIENIFDNLICIWHYNHVTEAWEVASNDNGNLVGDLTELRTYGGYVVIMERADTWEHYQNYVNLIEGENDTGWFGLPNTPVEEGLTGLDDNVVIWREVSPGVYELYCPYLPDELNNLDEFISGEDYQVYVSSNTTWYQQ